MLRVGFDAVKMERMEKKVQNAHFRERVFSSQENMLLDSRPHPAQTAAANFAAKEALSKALRCGIFGFDLREAAVLRREDGSPYFAFSGELAQRMLREGYTAQVSLSHEGDYAFAFVLLQPGKE